MAKAPAFQFYVRDWLCDPDLSQVSHTVKGVWIDMLCWMWLADERGVLNGTQTDLCKLLKTHHRTFKTVVKNAQAHPFCNYLYAPLTGEHRFENRRMVAEEAKKRTSRASSRKYRRKLGDPSSDSPVIPPSATASATATAVTVRDVSPEPIPDGPKGWMAVACTLTGRTLREGDFEAARKNAATLFARHGNTASEVLTVVHRGPPQIKYPSWLLKSACQFEATETEAEHVARVTREEGWDD